MSFQAYLDNIKAKTGKTPADFKAIAEKKGLLKPGTKAGEIVAWLKKDFGLGHGHAMAIYTVFKGLKEQKEDKKASMDRHFTGEKEKWRTLYDQLWNKVTAFGKDINPDPVVSYISLLRGKRKFAIVQVTRDRVIVGVKLKEQLPTARFEKAGNWNTMMTHKVSVISSKELDKELFTWLQRAYEQNETK